MAKGKPDSAQDLLPRWTKFVVTDNSGRDPLGLSRVAAIITDHPMNGVVLATDRARYYALYPWILWSVQKSEAPKSDASFEEEFQRREAAFAVSTILQSRTASVVGKRAVEKALQKADGEIAMAFRVLPSSPLGGFGQGYGGSIFNLGLTHRPQDEFWQITQGRGERLAKVVDETINTTSWAKESGWSKPRIALQTLKNSAERLSIDAIVESFAEHERRALTDVFFGLDEEEIRLPSPRRNSLARLLTLVDLYNEASIPLGQSDLVSLDDQVLLGPAYYGTLVDAAGKAAGPFLPPPFLLTCNEMWRQFCLHELVSWCLDSVLSAVVTLLGETPGGSLTLAEVIEQLSGDELGEAIEGFCGFRAESPADLLKHLGVTSPPTTASCRLARMEYSLSAALNENVLMRMEAPTPVEVLGRALPCFGLLFAKWREASDDVAWLEVRKSAGTEASAATTLPLLDSWLDRASTWASVARTLIQTVLTQQDRIMYDRGQLNAAVLRQGDRLVHDRDYGVAYPAHASRQFSAFGILKDLGLVLRNKDGQLSPTPEGTRVLAIVSGVAS